MAAHRLEVPPAALVRSSGPVLALPCRRRSRLPVFLFALVALVCEARPSEALAFVDGSAAAASATPSAPAESLPPSWGMGPFSEDLARIGRAALDLLAWLKTNAVAQFPDETQVRKYNRRLHFGGWVRPDPSSCFNTRAAVLERDAEPNSTQTSANGCTIVSGRWHDPYTGTDYATARSVQIDHVVPLKHAYYSGAHAWAFTKRCHYANFLSNAYHLLAVSGRENMSKGDRSPEGYLPPNRGFQCRYLGIWARIKAIWQLQATADEVRSIEQTARDRGCTARDFAMDSDELAAQRRAAEEIGPSCDRPDPIDDDSSSVPVAGRLDEDGQAA